MFWAGCLGLEVKGLGFGVWRLRRIRFKIWGLVFGAGSQGLGLSGLPCSGLWDMEAGWFMQPFALFYLLGSGDQKFASPAC